MTEVKDNKKFYQQTWFVIIMLALFAPIGLYLMWAKTDWPKQAKITATVLVVCLYLYVYVTDVSKRDLSTTQSNSNSASSKKPDEKPTIKVNGAKYLDDQLVITTQKADYSLSINTGSQTSQSNVSLTVNNNELTPFLDSMKNMFSYPTTLKAGDNKFDIVASTSAGKDEESVIVKYTPKATSAAVDDSIPGKLAVSTTGVTIVNQSNKKWGQCIIELNDTATSRPFIAVLKSLEINTDTSAASPNYVPFSSFVKSTGERFNPSQVSVTKAYISCYDDQGNEGSMSY